MKKHFINSFLISSILLSIISLIGCSTSPKNDGDKTKTNLYALLPDDSCGNIIKECIINSGGLEKWQQIKVFSYTKFIEQYDSLGNLAKEVTEYHTYQLQPKWKVRMQWKDQENEYVLINDGEHAEKYVNGVLDTSKKAYRSATLKTGGSFYVFGMPYNLTDPKARFTYEGEQEILGKKVYCIRANYPEGDSLAALYPWRYFFDVNTKALIASAINEDDGTYDLTEYLAFDTSSGMSLQAKRIIYLADKNRKPMYKGNVVTNKDFKFHESVPDSVFAAPVIKSSM